MQDPEEQPWLQRGGLGQPWSCKAQPFHIWIWGLPVLKMNDDGSFNMLIGATDLGTGSDTVLAQMAAEVLGVPIGGHDRLFFRYRFHSL